MAGNSPEFNAEGANDAAMCGRREGRRMVGAPSVEEAAKHIFGRIRQKGITDYET
jgi:hypothetical protein